MTLQTEAKHAVSCPRCGAKAGEVCRSRTGGELTNGHKARIDSYNNMGHPLPEFITHTDQLLSEIADHREERINQVLFGIQFAREILHLPQAVVDQNLAAMIVDAELDLKLF